MASLRQVPEATQHIYQSGREVGFSLSREGYLGSERKTIHPEASPWAGLTSRAGVDGMRGHSLRVAVHKGVSGFSFLCS